MNAQGSAGRPGGIVIVAALAVLLLARSAAADDTMIVYGKRMQKAETPARAQSEVDTAGMLVALNDELLASIHDDIRASLHDGFTALLVEIAENQGTDDIKVAAVTTRAGV